jgi:hypothetical protein
MVQGSLMFRAPLGFSPLEYNRIRPKRRWVIFTTWAGSRSPIALDPTHFLGHWAVGRRGRGPSGSGILGGLFLFDQLAKLLPEFRRVLVAVNGHGMLYRGIDQLFLGVRGAGCGQPGTKFASPAEVPSVARMPCRGTCVKSLSVGRMIILGV